MSDYKGPERRKYARIEATFIISYKIEQLSPDDNSNNVLEGHDLSQTRNISQGGLLVTTNQFFKKGNLLTMSLRFPLLPNKIEVTGEVVDCHEVVKNLIYETRIKFVNIGEDFFKRLGDFVEKNVR